MTGLHPCLNCGGPLGHPVHEAHGYATPHPIRDAEGHEVFEVRNRWFRRHTYDPGDRRMRNNGRRARGRGTR